jgi:hypothetical protein
MLSKATYAEIARITDEVLLEIPTIEIVERILIIRGSLQLLASSPKRTEYEAKISAGIRGLSRMAEGYGKVDLMKALDALLVMIDRERGADN